VKSIRNRLLIWQTLAIAGAAVVVSLITYHLTWDGFNRLRDYTLEQIARSVLQYGVEPIGSPDNVQFVSQIYGPDGQLRFASRPGIRLPLQAPGMHTVELSGETWHVFTLRSEEAIVQVANSATNRADMFAEISPWLLLPLALLVGLLGALLWLAVGRALRPFDAIRREIAVQSPEHLTALATRGQPREVMPLITTLNTLLERIEQLLSTQRRFIADAAHELRTPLTAIKLQTEIALTVGSAAERQEALDLLHASVDRATRLVEQLLQLARLDPDFAARRARERVSLDALARSVVAAFTAQADTRGIDLGLGDCAAVAIDGDAEGLRVMLGNLVDNAIRYGRAGGRIDVELRATAERIELSVADDGPGIPDEEKPAVFERFRRGRDPAASGSGLGLSIVREIASQHGGQVELLDCPGGGLAVRIALPGPVTR
jgi:two-component system OmpR family sensor kinase